MKPKIENSSELHIFVSQLAEKQPYSYDALHILMSKVEFNLKLRSI